MFVLHPYIIYQTHVCLHINYILNCHSSNKLKVGDSTSAICITNKKYNIYLNVVVYINKINIDGTFDLTILTVLKKNNFGTLLKRYINKDLFNNIIFINV